jgi:hypothetical protein
MKKFFTLVAAAFVLLSETKSQIVLNELYTDPGSGNNEFFELYNTNPSSSAFSVNNLTLITFFEISGTKGFYVMDLPNMTVAARSYFVGSSAIPFNYQGVSNSSASDFSWNSAAFTSNQGFVKKWVQGGLNLVDGNLFYDQASIPANFNDFFYRRTGSGASYTVFLYNNGQLINAFAGGTGGNNTIINDIVNMPNLFVDMSGASPDFTINFSGYSSLPIEYCTNDAGSDNGYIRQYDGACASWTKSSSQVQHTPKASNGTLIGINNGSVSVAVSIRQGISTFGSMINSDVVSAPASYFPIELQMYKDLGTTWGQLDPADPYFKSNTENVITDGPFHDMFMPSDANIMLAVKTSAGCYDKILFVTNTIILSVKMLSFTGNRTNDDINLNWAVAANEMADRYEVQRSTDGINFTTVGSVRSTDKTGNQSYAYKSTDTDSEQSFYRLRIFNKNGQVEYSETLLFRNSGIIKQKVTILNNPVRDKLMLSINTTDEQSLNLRLYDLSGHSLLQTTITAYKGINKVNIPLPAAAIAGAYIMEITGTQFRFADKFIVQ